MDAKYNEFLAWAKIQEWIQVGELVYPNKKTLWLTPTGRVVAITFTSDERMLSAEEMTDGT